MRVAGLSLCVRDRAGSIHDTIEEWKIFFNRS